MHVIGDTCDFNFNDNEMVNLINNGSSDLNNNEKPLSSQYSIFTFLTNE